MEIDDDNNTVPQTTNVQSIKGTVEISPVRCALQKHFRKWYGVRDFENVDNVSDAEISQGEL